MSYHTIIVHSTLGDLLKRVPQIMLSKKAAAEYLSSLWSHGSIIPRVRRSSLWFPASSLALSSILTADELALEISLIFESTAADVQLQDSEGRPLGFLSAEQAKSLTEGIWERVLN